MRLTPVNRAEVWTAMLAQGVHAVVLKAVMGNDIAIFAGPATPRLGAAVCHALQLPAGLFECRRFPDGEIQIEVNESVRGRDVYLVQSTSPPVEQHLMELLLLADACRRAGARRQTAVIPYFGYARQDRRSGRQSLGGRVAARIIDGAGFDRIMLIDAHTPAIEGFFSVPLDHLSAVPILARALTPAITEGTVIVAPDFGAVKRARAYATLLERPMAVVHKTRLDGEAVQAHEVIGDVRGRQPLIVDDMVSTGATIEAAVGALIAAGATAPIAVAATHGLFVGRAREIFQKLPLASLTVTDSVAAELPERPLIHVCTVAALVATAIRRHHNGESLADLRASA
jgi:ribose-phosphate pyrophosphokinase